MRGHCTEHIALLLFLSDDFLGSNGNGTVVPPCGAFSVSTSAFITFCVIINNITHLYCTFT